MSEVELEASLFASSEVTTEGTPTPAWQYKTSFGINDRMKEVIELTIRVANEEIARNRRKIDKLTYGV
jgi:hypothetical protein